MGAGKFARLEQDVHGSRLNICFLVPFLCVCPLFSRVPSLLARVPSLFVCVLSLCLCPVFTCAQARAYNKHRPLLSSLRGHKTQPCDSSTGAASSSNSCTVCTSEIVARQVRKIAGRLPTTLCGLSGRWKSHARSCNVALVADGGERWDLGRQAHKALREARNTASRRQKTGSRL